MCADRSDGATGQGNPVVLPGRGQWWDVQSTRGSAADLHHREIPKQVKRLVWAHAVESPALVLGSTQPDTDVDLESVAASSTEVVRRRSGGGAVFVRPFDTWIDLLIGSDDPLWDADVGKAFGWVGGVWQRALTSLGVAGTSLHTGPMIQRQWGRTICFAGSGPGEVLGPDGRKIVGLSQRRTRTAARFQTMVPYLGTLVDTAHLLSSSALPPDLEPSSVTVGAALDSSVLTFAFLEELHRLP